MKHTSLRDQGITVQTLFRNPSPAVLYEHGLKRAGGPSIDIASSGAMIASSGAKTGRSPGDKRIVRHPESESDIWWGPVNVPCDESNFATNRQRAIDYLNTCEQLFIIDGFAGWDREHRVKVRIVCERPYHALFMHNMLIRPTAEELADYGEPDFVIYNAGRFPADPELETNSSDATVSLSFERGEMIILGTEYAGEMKKGVFTIMNYLMPKKNVLSMHCSANEGENGDVSIFFGLSGTGKTTLSADPKRQLIGDDEHCWTETGVFNIEGGCYAKVIALSAQAEPEIHAAIRFGAVLENVVFDSGTREVDYDDDGITQNTRCSYPIEHIDNAKIPCLGGRPKNVVFLTCDAFSVLPPVSRLDPERAMYHFISGYTAKIAGTEMGVTQPEATFSACFGAPFMVWHPTRYAELLAERMRADDTQVWLVNTGWSGGPYGVGARMSIAQTRAIIDGIHDDTLAKAPTRRDAVFGFDVPTQCQGVPAEILDPRQSWSSPVEYDAAAKRLAELFHANFRQYEDRASMELRGAGPRLG